LGAGFAGYEMHMGRTDGADTQHPFATFGDGRADGAIAPSGLVMGTYVHGLLSAPDMRRALLARIGATGSGADYSASIDAALDEIAGEIERHVAVDALIAIAQSWKRASSQTGSLTVRR
jgi:adenosylcobyric acid synthase